jgi:molecular chaperone DnaK
VSFDIDADGILHVSAKDKATNKEQRIVIQSSGGLSDTAIEDMIKDAEMNAQADKDRRESVEARNNLDGLIHTVTKNLDEHKEKLDDAVKADIEKALEEARAVDQSTPLADITQKSEALSAASMKIGESMYKKDGAEEKKEGEEEVSEAEYTEKKEEGEKKEEEKK